MAEFVVNVVLLVAVLVLLIAWAVNASRRRRIDRREHAAQRSLILAAVRAVAAPVVPAGLSEDGEPAHTDVARPSSDVSTAPGQFDAAAVAALLDLLEGRRPVRRGLFAGLVTSPRSVWSAGTRAGQSVGRRTVRDRHARVSGEPDSELYRDAAAELVDIHGHDPIDAHLEYFRFEAAVGDPVLAELYVRCAAYTTYADHDHVLRVVGDITSTTYPPKLSDDAATIDT